NVHLLVILQNTKQMPEAQGPKSWADLLKPEYKGKVACTYSSNSGSAYSNVAMWAQMWGNNDDAWKKVSDLIANTRVLNRSSLVFQAVGMRELRICVVLEYIGEH